MGLNALWPTQPIFWWAIAHPDHPGAPPWNKDVYCGHWRCASGIVEHRSEIGAASELTFPSLSGWLVTTAPTLQVQLPALFPCHHSVTWRYLAAKRLEITRCAWPSPASWPWPPVSVYTSHDLRVTTTNVASNQNRPQNKHGRNRLDAAFLPHVLTSVTSSVFGISSKSTRPAALGVVLKMFIRHHQQRQKQ